jgi:septum formation protein
MSVSKKRALILASSSPRRRDLLEQAGFSFTIISPDVDERLVKGESSKKMVERLAREKARACLRSVSPKSHSIVIASDTTVVIGPKRKILGKPESTEDAIRMLGAISGKTHEVLTSFCVLEVKNGKIFKEVVKTISTQVSIRKIALSERRAYVKTKEPLDKAGSYGAQGIGMIFIEKISGSYTNVVGLPMTELCKTLGKDFKVVPQWHR